MSLAPRGRFWYGCLTLLLLLAAPGQSLLVAGEETVDTYADVRFPHMQDGVIRSEVLAGTADALGMSASVRRINVRQVEILVYADPPPGLPGGEAPPVRMRIVGDRGVIESRRGADGGNEDFAHIQGEVRAFRFDLDADDPKTLDSVISCQNATWNHTRQVLEGSGPATMLQRGSVLKGSDFHYWARGTARSLNVAAMPGEREEREAGESGWFKLDKNVSMEFVRHSLVGEREAGAPETSSETGEEARELPLGVPEAADTTLITCAGAGVYDLQSGKVHFQDDVRVTKEGMLLRSQRLRAILNERAEVRSVIAWDDVRIEGETRSSARTPASRYTAHGNYARFRADTEDLFLSDQREGRLPLVVYGRDEIRDVNIRLDTRSGELEAYGGEGEARLHARMQPESGEPLPVPRLAVIHYTDRLEYDRLESRCVFTGDVRLRQEGLELEGERVVAEMGPVRAGSDALGIRQLTAEGDVRIDREGKIATGARAEMDVAREEIVLFGPPKPTIREENVWEMQAERIENIQIVSPPENIKKNIIKTEGPGTGKFLPPEARPGPESGQEPSAAFQQTIVTYTKSMDYNEALAYAFFIGDVITTSRDYVLKSDRLKVDLEEARYWDAAKGVETVRQEPRVITAEENASLFWHRRNCVADKIVRDEQKQIMIFYGSPGALAVVYEEGGSTIRSPRITATADGHHAQAIGVGEVILPDARGESRAVVTFDGEARYRSIPDENRSRIEFYRNVRMKRSDGMIIQGDTMVVDLEEVSDPARVVHRMLSPTPGDEARPRRLKRVVMTGNVVVRQGTMVGYGARGELQIRDSGEVTLLEGTESGRAEVVDAKGFRLFAPEITHWNDRQILSATGPGKAHLISLKPIEGRVGGFRSSSEKLDYTLEYDGNLNYNALARKITAERNVQLMRSNLRCTCDEMTVILEEPLEESGLAQGEGLLLTAVEARGNVRYTRFEPLRERESYLDPFNNRRDPMNRPGTLIKTKSEEAYYDVPKDYVTLTGSNPQPKLLTQNTPDSPDERRERWQYAEDVLGFYVDRGDVVMENPRIRKLPSTGPLTFDDE